jgi:hypothetical protein
MLIANNSWVAARDFNYSASATTRASLQRGVVGCTLVFSEGNTVKDN